MTLTDEERKKCIAHSLSGTYYVGMAIVKHNIKQIIKYEGGFIIFKGKLHLRHIPSKVEVIININSDKPNLNNHKRCYGFIERVRIKELGDEEFRESDGYEIRNLTQWR